MAEKVYGRYEIESELGRGGMSTVYLANDPRFGRKVAIKVMSRALQDDPSFRGRFEREARIIATLEHPAIVPVYDYGEDHDQPFLVMRYMPGGTLADRIIAGPMSLQAAVPIIQRLADALDHAHQQGVIHRDLKPSNILFDRYDNAFLTDFGIVKLAHGATANLTGSGVIGTPAYMSPEQIHGDNTLDGRSDIYSLGIILFEMLTGRKPYRADTPIKQMMAHVLNPIPQIRDLKPGLPDQLETVIQRVLAKERNDRFATGTDLTLALSQSLPIRPFASEAAEPGRQPSADLTGEDETTMAIERPADPAEAATARIEEPDLADALKEKRPFRRYLWPLVGFLLLAAFLWGSQLLSVSELEPTITAEAVVLTVPTQEIASPTPPPTASPEPSVTPVASPTPTEVDIAGPLPTPIISTIGQSVSGQPIEAVRIGTGQTVLIFVGGLHAGFAPGSVDLAQRIVTYFSENLVAVPPEITMIIIPNANPDSPRAPGQLAGRLNGNGVDLNRNWDCRWTPNPPWGSEPVEGLGGPEPFSEPEVRSLANFIQAQQSAAVIFWQARAAEGLVSPGGCIDGTAVSQPLADVYGGSAEFRVADFENLVNTVVYGDATNWLDKQGIPAISVLLTDYTATNFSQNLLAIQATMDYFRDRPAGEEP